MKSNVHLEFGHHFRLLTFIAFNFPFLLHFQVPLPTNMGSLRVEKDKVVVGDISGGATLDDMVAAIKVTTYTSIQFVPQFKTCFNF